MSQILVLVDHVEGSVRKTTFELLTIARRLGEPAAVFAASLNVTDSVSTCGSTGAGSGAAEFGFTVISGIPWVTCAVTVNPPAKAACVVSIPASPCRTSPA